MDASDTLTTLFRHNRWANLEIVACCAKLTDEQLASGLPGTYGAIRDTLQHIAVAERSYFSRISTGQPHRHPPDAPPLTLDDIAVMLDASGSGMIEWATSINPDDTVTVDWEGNARAVPKTILLTQAINHATEHRAQIMAIMTTLGVQPPELDGWTYFESVG